LKMHQLKQTTKGVLAGEMKQNQANWTTTKLRELVYEAFIIVISLSCMPISILK
jgi:hypothetical protein